MKDEIKEIFELFENQATNPDIAIIIKTLKEWYFEKENYKSRNEKAIEYIYEHREEALFEDTNGKLVYALSDNFDEGDLLNILQGEDKDE